MPDLRRQLAERVVDPFLWSTLKRYPLLHTLAELRERQWDDQEAFRDRQAALLAALLSHAVGRVRFYGERTDGLLPSEIARDPHTSLAAFPILEKKHLLEHVEDLRCEMGRGAYENTSGGSTGKPVRFRQDKTYLSRNLAVRRLVHEWAGVRVGERHAKLWGARRDIARGGAAVKRRLGDFLLNRLTLDAFAMDSDTMHGHIRLISQFRPVLLEGYADALHELALFAERNGLGVASPRAIVTSATTLFPQMRETIARVFGAPVFDRYGSREVGSIASECDQHEGLHIVGETTVVEVVDELGRHVGAGEEGDVLVTSLWNYTMPFIRYRIGDRAVRGNDRCSCGRPYPLLARIAGRSDACLARPDGGVVVPEFFVRLLRVECGAGVVHRFQVVQEELDEVLVRIVPWVGKDSEVLSHEPEIVARIREAMGGACRVRVVLEDDIEPTPTGKHLLTVSKVGRPTS